MLDTNFILSIVATLFICALLLFRLPRIAYRINLLDNPDERKLHDASVPLVGGIAIYISVMFALLLLDTPLGHMRGYFAGAALLIVVGVLDDLHELSSVARFIAQILAAIFMAEWGDVRLIDLGWISPSGELVQLNWWSSLLTIFATVGVINAMNMIDGIDGLAGTIALIAFISMAILSYLNANTPYAQVLLILSCSVVVFLFFNRRTNTELRYRVFLGDAGSMFLGFTLCWFFIYLSQGNDRTMTPVTALWIFFIPLIDTVSQMFRRILKGRSPFSADRGHMHHLLMDRGMSHRKTYLLLSAIALIAASFGLAADQYDFSQPLMFYSFLGCFAVYFIYILTIKHSGPDEAD